MNALVMLSSSCKGKKVKIYMTVTAGSLPLSLNTLSIVSLKKSLKKHTSQKKSSKNPTKNSKKPLTPPTFNFITHSAIFPAHRLKERSPQGS